MTISTQDCKEFIRSISSTINADVNDKWKRTKKYKENILCLRDFENQFGRTLTIAENNGQLFLYQLIPLAGVVQSIFSQETIPGRYLLGRVAKEKDIVEFISRCVKEDHDIVLNEDNTLVEAMNSHSWEIFQKWSSLIKKSDGFSAHPLDYFFEDNDGNFEEFDLFYPDENGNTLQIDKENILQVFWIWMPNYDTSYRIYIFETKNHELLLGCNNPD